MRYRNPFTLFKKTLKSGKKIWYYTFYDADGKRRQLSTGQTQKALAQQVCLSLYYSGAMFPNVPNQIPQLISLQAMQMQNIFFQAQSGGVGLVKNQWQEQNKKKPTFKEYTENWFIPGKCEYIKGKLLHGFPVAEGYADDSRKILETKLIPFFGKYRLDGIDERLVDKFYVHLKGEGLSNVSINNITKRLKLILGQAYKRGDLDADIARKIKPLKDDSKTHGICTPEQVELLFDRSKAGELWDGSLCIYGANLLASKTGMRIGEIQALRKPDIFADHIIVAHSWHPKYGLKDTKTHKSRCVPISAEVYSILMEIADGQTEGEYVFSADSGKTPETRFHIYKPLKTALERIGISREEQKERFITFHSWRHYVNSRLVNSGVPKSVVQSIIGHVNDDAMTERYTHVTLDDQKAVLGVV